MLKNKMIVSAGRINAWFVISVVFLFPLVAIINYVFEIQSGVLSQSYRVINLGISLLIIGGVIIQAVRMKEFKISLNLFWVILFWAIYLFRLFVDLEAYNIHENTPYKKSYYYLYTLGVTFIPMLAISFCKPIDFNYLIRDLKKVLALFNICILVFFLRQVIYSKGTIFRFYLTKGEIDYLNPITIGVYTAMLMLIILFTKKKMILDYMLLIIASVNLFASASRGPLLFVFITIVIAGLYNLSLFFKNSTDLLLKSVFLVIAIVIVLNLFDLVILDRFENIFSDDSAVIRTTILNNAIDQFLTGPIFGTHFLVVESNSYSHNILIDALLANGVIGLFLLVPLFALLIFIAIKNKFKSIYLIITFYLFLNMFTSGTIYNSNEFWITFAVVLTNQRKFFSKTSQNLNTVKQVV